MSNLNSVEFGSHVRIDTGFVVSSFKAPSGVNQDSLRAIHDPSLGYNLPGGCDISFPNEPTSEDLLVQVYNSKTPRLTKYRGRYNLHGPSDNPNFFKQFPYIAYTLGEKERSYKHQAVTIHASAVGMDPENGLLILGDKGSGKTSLALTLAKREGLSLVGNDLVLVTNTAASLGIMDGTKMINTRFAVVDNLFGDQIDYDPSGKHPYEDKIYIMPEDVGLNTQSQVDSIKAIVRVNVHPGNDGTKLEDGPRRTIEALRIYENAGRYIKGTVTPLILRGAENFGYIPSLEDATTQQVRDEMINRMLNLPFYYLTTNDIAQGAREVISAIK